MIQQINFNLYSVFSLSILQALRFSEAVDVTKFGAIGDGRTDDSQAFLKAWEAVCGGGGDGPELVIPAGKTFMLQPLKFQGPCKSPTINVQILGNIVAPRNRNDWTGDKNSWIIFSGIDGLIVNGSGQIDGQGSSWWDHSDYPRPTALKFERCDRLEVSGLRHINSPMAHIRINDCDGVTISNLEITAPESSPNTDGIDVGGSTNVQILQSIIRTGDDCIAITSGSSFINISGIICGPGHGISIGSLGKDGDAATVEEVYVQNCELKGTTNGARIKTWEGGKGYARKITFQGITLENVQNPIIIDQYYCDRNNDPDCKSKSKKSAVKVSDVSYSGFRGTSNTKNGITFRCSQTEPCSNIYMHDINIKSVETGEFTLGTCSNVQGTTTAVLPGLQCLSIVENQQPEGDWRLPTAGGRMEPLWVEGGAGKQSRVHEAILIFLFSCLINFGYVF